MDDMVFPFQILIVYISNQVAATYLLYIHGHNDLMKEQHFY